MKSASLPILLASSLFTLLSSPLATLAHPHTHASPDPLPEALANPEAYANASPEPLPAPIVAREPAAEAGLESRAPMARVITRCTRANAVALTFDDGPYIYQNEILATLAANSAKATFFVNGRNYGCIYEQRYVDSLRAAFGAGHQIASHTWAHLDLSRQTWDKIHDEMWKVELAMRRILGVSPAFMRPPFGNYNNLVREASYIRNQTLVTWDFDSGDSVGVSATGSQQRYTDVANRRPSTLLALNHETYASTARQVLPHALRVLREKGYQFVTVAECLGENPYSWTGTRQNRDAGWVC